MQYKVNNTDMMCNLETLKMAYYGLIVPRLTNMLCQYGDIVAMKTGTYYFFCKKLQF